MAELTPKTSIRDVPLANDRIYEEVARMNKTTKGEVMDIIGFVGSYIAEVIGKGTMETVMLPYFGKFKPQVRKVNALNKINANKRNGKDLIYRAMSGMDLKDFRAPETKTEEVVPFKEPPTEAALPIESEELILCPEDKIVEHDEKDLDSTEEQEEDDFIDEDDLSLDV